MSKASSIHKMQSDHPVHNSIYLTHLRLGLFYNSLDQSISNGRVSEYSIITMFYRNSSIYCKQMLHSAVSDLICQLPFSGVLKWVNGSVRGGSPCQNVQI